MDKLTAAKMLVDNGGECSGMRCHLCPDALRIYCGSSEDNGCSVKVIEGKVAELAEAYILTHDKPRSVLDDLEFVEANITTEGVYQKVQLPDVKWKEEPGGSTPSQYALPTNASELQDLIEYRAMNFAVGNIFKATYRLGNCGHSDKVRDLRKIAWFANRELAAALAAINEETP